MSFLLNPGAYDAPYTDSRTAEIMIKTIGYFENKGLARLREEDRLGVFYDDYIKFWKQNRILATLLTPAGYGGADSAFDLTRVCDYNEILGFYSPAYQYGYQVSVLGIGPLWMSDNEAVKRKTARLLEEGHIFAFGLSEKAHGADIYSNEMRLTPLEGGGYRADGSKYYIGNCNKAGIVATQGQITGTGEYVFFAVDSQHPNYKLVKQIETNAGTNAYVGEYQLIEYPIGEEDIISRGKLAWDSILSAINIGKFQLGFSSIGVATHALYEALDHAYNRILYGNRVTDFPHIKKSFVDAYVRTLAMKSFAYRSRDYFQACSDSDRRYLLYNPIQKYKVTSQAEKVVALLQNVIAARSFERESYFSCALTEVGMLPRLEGTVHVNLMQIIKFMPNYFFNPQPYVEVGRRVETGDDSNIFHQYAGKTGTVTFHDFMPAYETLEELPNVKIFINKIRTFKEMLVKAGPTPEQLKNIDFMLNFGEIFSMIVYGNMIAENQRFNPFDSAVLNRLYEVLIRDISEFALNQIQNFNMSDVQEGYFQALTRKAALDPEQDDKIWRDFILPLAGSYIQTP